MTAPDLKPCPFCKGGIISIEGKGQIWRGVNGYSDPQWYQLNHYGKLSKTDDFPRCSVEFRCRTEAEAIAAWNTRAPLAEALALPEVAALVSLMPETIASLEGTGCAVSLVSDLRAALRAIGERADG